MAGPPSSAFTELSIVFGGASSPNGAVVTLGLSGAPGGTWTAEDVTDSVRDRLLGLITASSTIVECRFKVGPVATGPTYIVPIGTSGTASGFASSPQTALLVRKQVPNMSQRFSGRMYFPAPTGNWINTSGEIVTPGTPTEIIDNWFADLLALEADPVVFSSVSSDPRPVNALVLMSRVATQRRRVRR